MPFDFENEEYKGGGGLYITGAEKTVLAESGIPFTITEINYTTGKFENDQYELSVIVPNPETGDDEERILAFAVGSKAESRDKMLAGMSEHIAETGETVTAKLEKIGRGYYLRSAEGN